MDENALNQSVRKFLKIVGVTSQREIELAVRKAVEDGSLKGDETMTAQARITVNGIDLDVRIDGKIVLK